MHIYQAKSSRFELTDFASVMIDAADVISVPSVNFGLGNGLVSQCWPKCPPPYDVTRPQWVKIVKVSVNMP